MNLRTKLSMFALVTTLSLGLADRASAHEEKHKNLQAIQSTGKDVETGMKALSKGLGLKCNACHVKGEFDSDNVPEKIEARKFLVATVGQPDKAKREEALKTLLAALKLTAAKSPDDVWRGIDTFKKK